jgi:hypothetical protein
MGLFHNVPSQGGVALERLPPHYKVACNLRRRFPK